ncbi:probable G-protein coupled receptor 113 [Stegastes partitus]|uniref:Probable G-protein coupled receptor 113 n=1 Tax=Stegastes partitus TaxID=144197 RepID=A0A3B5AWK5_9TELE|nr:PREDICTED: probable G-protein coupled receptor 113 [Stegastes partitus]
MMWIFIFLYVLCPSICQATVKGNSTKIYYFKLTIDKNAVGNITKLLTPYQLNDTLTVNELKQTTKCQSDSESVTCSCEPGHRWSDDVRRSYKCNDSCTFPSNEAQMCVSDGAVVVSGSATLKGEKYQSCVTKKTSVKYEECNRNLSTEMKKVFSTLRGFDILTITEYRIGSIIADFEMNFADRIISNDLIEKTGNLSTILPASLELETAGVVHIHMETRPVRYNGSTNFTCIAHEDLVVTPKWTLESPDGIFDITNGTVATVTSPPKQTTIKLTGVSEIWKGNYTCKYYYQRDGFTILHKASATLDVCLLPNIHVSTEPPFPRCKPGDDFVKAAARCEIRKSSEPYNVTWTGDVLSSNENNETGVFTAETIVSCTNSSEPAELVCTFKNRCDQQKPASVSIYVIYANEKFCKAEGEWPETKPGFTAELKCKDAAGLRRRKCKSDGNWEAEILNCVNLNLADNLENAQIADSGRGNLDKNAADVFSSFKNSTNNTEAINSFANMNTSVSVLSTLNEKLKKIMEESVTNDFLESSSNLLEISLEEIWNTSTSETSLTLAEEYLSSVEQLIEKANVTKDSKKPNVEVVTCSDEDSCTNSVFNVNVTLKSSGNGTVKTTGFRQLERYLPYENQSSEVTPNSIVVSTTTDRNKDQVTITIDFQLTNTRPRHVQIQCVSWDSQSRRWSPDGCEWAGPANEGRCTCKHLSSFAILMSRYPIEVYGLTQITYVGLSVSVMSLIIGLMIELVVWGDVVKTNTLHLRHTAHVNISLCLLVADCCFLASTKPKDVSTIWCKTVTVLKHFCYLSMFFWMLCLSTTLLHQALYLFHQVSRTNYLRFSFILGYACPCLIVFVTFLTYRAGAEQVYYSRDTCWLIYVGLMEGSIHTFIIPVGIIIFINIFSMLVVIMKLLYHQENMEKSHNKEKAAAKTVLRSVVLLTPIFGVTWIFGFAVLYLDLTSGTIAYLVNYAFTLTNAFQGLFILLTTCLGDKMTRDALLKRFKRNAPVSTSSSAVKLDSSVKK